MARTRRPRSEASDESRSEKREEKNGEAPQRPEKVVEKAPEVENSKLESPKIARFSLVVGLIFGIAIGLTLYATAKDQRPEGAEIRYVLNPAEVYGTTVCEKTIVQDMHETFYIPVEFPLQEGDFVKIYAAGFLSRWTSAPDITGRGLKSIDPDGVDWTPQELRVKQPFIGEHVACGALMGVIGPRPVYDKEGIPLVKNGSRHFEIAKKRIFQVTKVTGNDDRLYLAMNRWWTVPAGREVIGEWGIRVTIIRPSL